MGELQYCGRTARRSGEELASFLSGLSWEALDEPLIDRARRAALDAVSVMLAGQETLRQSGRSLDSLLGGAGGASLALTETAGDAAAAAFVNAAYAQVHDFTDGFNRSGIYSGSFHPGRVIVPAVFAMGESAGASGRDVITALVAGYDVACRVRNPRYASVQIPDAMGAAAAAAKVAGADSEQLRNAMTIAASLCPCENMGIHPRGTLPFDTDYLVVGAVARAGVEAAQLALRGMTGPRFNDNPNYSQRFAARGLGREFSLRDTYLKGYPSCRKTHGAIEAALRLRREYGIAPGDVRELVVYQQTTALFVDSPVKAEMNRAQRQFSLQYCVACAFLDGEVSLRRFRGGDAVDPALLAFAGRIRVVPEDAFDGLCELTPNIAAIELTLQDGGKRSLVEEFPLGADPKPLSPAQSAQKLGDCAGSLLTAEERRRLIEAFSRLERWEKCSLRRSALLA